MSSVLRRAVSAPSVRVLSDAHRYEFGALLDADPYTNAVLSSRVTALGSLAPRRFGGHTLGAYTDGRLTAAVFCGGNLLPVGGRPGDWVALAARVAEDRRVCTSIVGAADAVAEFWRQLAPGWGPARAVRESQPLLMIDGPPALPADPRVRAIVPDELERYLPAAVAMFTEELGISPHVGAGAGDYRRRVAGLIRDRRAFGIIDRDGRVAFKADIGAVSRHTCQVQGVWVRPDLRGRGFGTAAMAGVLTHALDLAPTVSLYVNDFNQPARRMYHRLGLRPVATLSTILF